MILDAERIDRLRQRGVEVLLPPGAGITDEAAFEPPCSVKWMETLGSLFLGSFSYAVSGFFFDVRIGRYTSIGEQVQVGRASHPLHWMSTSPFLYLGGKLFDVGREFEGGAAFDTYTAPHRPGTVTTVRKPTRIGNDVYIGHGAMIMPGVTIGDGAVIGAMAVVTKDVPPYAVAAGNPATVRRMRFPEPIAERLLQLAWWRFAPWQLVGVNTANPEAAIPDLETLVAVEQPYAPPLVRLADLEQGAA